MQGNHIKITSQRPTRKETKSKMDKQIRNDLNGLKGEFKKNNARRHAQDAQHEDRQAYQQGTHPPD